MLISVQKRFMFVANTKAASTSIEAVLAGHAEIARPGGAQGKHVPLGKALYDYRFLFDSPGYPAESFFKFGVMRDPVDWIGSWFRFRKGNKVESPLPADMTFAQFWERDDWNIHRADGSPFLQSDIFCDGDGKVLADLIVPYHRLDDLMPRVLESLGITEALPYLNASRLRDWDEEIPPALREEMRRHFAADHALFDRLDTIVARGLERLRAREPEALRG